MQSNLGGDAALLHVASPSGARHRWAAACIGGRRARTAPSSWPAFRD